MVSKIVNGILSPLVYFVNVLYEIKVSVFVCVTILLLPLLKNKNPAIINKIAIKIFLIIVKAFGSF